MSKRGRELTGDEKKLWRRVADSVKPRRPQPAPEPEPGPELAPRKPPAPVAPKPVPRKPAAAPPADRGGEKRVRRGRVEIGATLDLHGHTQASARATLGRFLHAAHARGDNAVIIITGVGRGGEGVLKRLTPQWLGEADLRPLIAGFAQAHRSHGGAGAYYVFLKRPRGEPA